MSTFDQAARLASKLDGEGFHAWLLRCCGGTPDLAFHRWADARRLAVVPGLERIDDVVSASSNGRSWHGAKRLQNSASRMQSWQRSSPS